jgi:superfamily II DNA/RNA helicase
MSAFKHGSLPVLVATDVAARGIHVDNVDLVIHFDAANDPKAYLHRSGRTARAGLDGCVVTISTPKFVNQVARLQQGAGVEVLHHDIRSAPQPMTAASLAESGDPRPMRAPAGRSGGGHHKARQGRKPYRGHGGARRPEGRFEGRKDGRGDDHRGRGTKQRWSKEKRAS